MNAPTWQELKDPKWWDENCEPWAQVVAIEEDARGGFERLHQRQSTHGSVINVKHPDNDLTFYERPTQPAAPEWDGEGWPVPIGAELINWCGERRTVIAHDRENIICRCEEQKDSYVSYTKERARTNGLRPLRTPEQREREEVIGSIVAKLERRDWRSWEEAMGALYDAGMLRKGDE